MRLRICFPPLPVLLLTFLFIVTGILATPAVGHGKEPVATCDIQAGPCTRNLADGIVTLDILPRPVKAMETLSFRVTLTDLSPAGAPAIDLKMPGMKMGPNKVRLTRQPDGTWQGTGVIVRCPSGRTLWEAVIHVPGVGNAAFAFHVVY